MPIRFPVSEWFENSGNQAAEFSEGLRDGIATFACNLWANYPDFITKGTNPISSYARGFMNSACSPIQPFNPPPTVPFTGGQCPGDRYTVRIRWLQNNGSLYRLLTFDVFGPVSRVFGQFVPTDPNNPTGPGLAVGEVDAFLQDGTPNTFTNDGPESGPPENPPIYEVVPFFGGPDPCGDPPPNYESPEPTTIDLTTTININNGDGIVNSYKLVHNQLNSIYNFPIGFKIGGSNVVVDVGGITIFGSPQQTEPSGNDSIEPPGSDGGDDGGGGTNDELFPEVGFNTIPELVTPETNETDITYFLCEDGVITTITETLQLILSNVPYINIILLILENVVRELCQIGEVEPTVGIPDYYGVRPGQNRPAIVYLFKEVINNTWQRSTYSSTVVHPSAAAIAEIQTVVVPDKTLGTFVNTIKLVDGSGIKSSGDTSVSSLANFDFLLSRVDPTFLPPNANDCITETQYPKLQVKTVKCRQIEYYPEGKTAGVNPLIRRVIDLT